MQRAIRLTLAGLAEDPPFEGDPVRGELLFNGQVSGRYPGSVCHSLRPNETLVGPSLAEIAATAATRRQGIPAEAYLRQSIVSPDAYIVEGLAAGTRPATFGAQATETGTGRPGRLPADTRLSRWRAVRDRRTRGTGFPVSAPPAID